MIWTLTLLGAFLGVQAWPVGWSGQRPWTHDLMTDHLGYNDHGFYNGPWNPEYIRSHRWYNPSRSLHVGDDHDDFFHGDLNDHYYDYHNRDFSDYYHGDINDRYHGPFDDHHYHGDIIDRNHGIFDDHYYRGDFSNYYHDEPFSFLDSHHADNFELDSSLYPSLHRPIEMATENYVREYPFKGMEYGIRDSVSFLKPTGHHYEELPTRLGALHQDLEHGPAALHHFDNFNHGLTHGSPPFHRLDDFNHGYSSFHHLDDYDHLGGLHPFDCEDSNMAFHRRSFAPGLSHLPIPFRMGSDILLRR